MIKNSGDTIMKHSDAAQDGATSCGVVVNQDHSRDAYKLATTRPFYKDTKITARD